MSASLLSRASVDDQHIFIKAWADVLAVCASELQHASMESGTERECPTRFSR